MKRQARKRLLCGMLSTIMLLTGCAQRGVPASEESPSKGGTNSVSAVSAADLNIRRDSVIQGHLENNRNIVTQRVDREAKEFCLYVENSKMMEGFIPGAGSASSAYQETVQSLKDVISNGGFQEKEAYVLSSVSKGEEPEWKSADLDATLNRMHRRDLYAGVEVPEVSPLEVMEHPFGENLLTVIVTNLMEPNNDLNAIVGRIRSYFDKYENSAACLMEISSEFEGTYYIPSYANKEQWRIENIKPGDKNSYPVMTPFYLIMVGPEPAVRKFASSMEERLSKKSILPVYGVYTNNVYAQIIDEPLHFRVLEDLKLKKASTNIVRSYNTGMLYEDGAGSAYYSNSGQRVKTLDADVDPGKNVRISNSTQISLMSEDYDGLTSYKEEHTLYVFNPETNKWEETEKNARDNAFVTLVTEKGELRDDYADEPILSSGKQVRISAKLDFSSTSPLKREKMYRMEVRLLLNHENPNAKSDAAGEQLRSFSINRQEFDSAIEKLSSGSQNNRIWTASFSAGKKAAPALSKTPNLEELLTSLEELESEYKDTREVVQYVDFVFNVPVQEQ